MNLNIPVVLLDSELTMKQHVDRVAGTCRLGQLKRHVTLHTIKHLVSALILSRLDYCNSVLAGLPWSTVAPLQIVQIPGRYSSTRPTSAATWRWRSSTGCRSTTASSSSCLCWCSKHTFACVLSTSETPWRWPRTPAVGTVCAPPTPPTTLFQRSSARKTFYVAGATVWISLSLRVSEISRLHFQF